MSLLLLVGISQTLFLIGCISLDKLQKIAKISPARSLHRDRHQQPTVVLSIALTVLLDISTVQLLHVFTRLPAFLLETGPHYRSVIVSFLCISLTCLPTGNWTALPICHSKFPLYKPNVVSDFFVDFFFCNLPQLQVNLTHLHCI